MKFSRSDFSAVKEQLSLVFAILAGLILMLIIAFLMRTGDDRILKAEETYRAGESAPTIAARQNSFNQTLDSLLSLEATYRPYFGNGHLYYDIGNTYFQLGQYPLAIQNYLQAKSLMPRDDRVERNLTVARKKLALTETDSQSTLDTVFFTRLLSLPERLQLFFIVSLILLLLFSGWIWTKASWYRNCSVLALSVVVILGMSLSYSRYFSPLRGVLIHATELRRDAGMAFAKVNDQPIPAGTVVNVLASSSDVTWLKVVVPSGEFGYAPQESVGVIR